MTLPDWSETRPTSPEGISVHDTRNEVGRFIVVGLLTVLIDFVAYRVILSAGLEVSWSKAIGFLIGTVFAYIANRRFTFAGTQQKQRSAIRFSVLYATTLAINVGVNRLVLVVLQTIVSDAVALPFAFVCSTALSAILNFVGMKFFVFRARD